MIDSRISSLYLKLVSTGCKKSTKVKILNVFITVFMNTNTFEMYLNTNTLHFSQKYSNTNTFKTVFKHL